MLLKEDIGGCIVVGGLWPALGRFASEKGVDFFPSVTVFIHILWYSIGRFTVVKLFPLGFILLDHRCQYAFC